MNLSFEEELTFAPKLNSLSMKLAGVNRTSILERPPKEKNNVLDSSFTFKPAVSGHSSKIVAKLKTGFWERQSLHVKHQQEKIEQGPSTMHPHHKRSFHYSKEKLDEPDNRYNKCKVTTSMSEETCERKDSKKNSKSRNSYSKSMDGFTSLKEKKKELQSEIASFRKKCGKSPAKASTHEMESTTKLPMDKLQSQQPKIRKNVIVVSPRKMQSISPAVFNSDGTAARRNLFRTKSTDANTHDGKEGNSPGKKTSHPPSYRARTLTHPVVASKSKTDKMDLEHQRLMRAKKLASQALKGKKVFVCSGPYSTLKTALRRRGWIEKNFKNVAACCVEEGKETPEKESSGNDSGFSSDDSNNKEIKEKSSHEELEEVFSSDSQYGIMSRIVRNSSPTLIWTLRRDDINFRLLQKDQIVNHYVSAWTFTTKTGLCTNLRNIVSFDTKDWRTFFPRCYRLCCEEEKLEFIDDYRLTTVQSILRMVIERHEEWKVLEADEETLKKEMQKKCYEDCGKSICSSPILKQSRTPRGEKNNKCLTVLPSSSMTLVLNKCNGYLDVRNNRDLDVLDDYSDQCLQDLHWCTIINYYNQIIDSTAIISNAWQYLEECKQVLNEMQEFCPQLNIDGCSNMWILKPGAKSRGRGIEIKNNLNEMLNISSAALSTRENKWVIQKYIEKPFLVYRTKFDIRQWFLVTDWNPLMIWFYQDCYIRFCSQEFTLNKFDPQVHLSNNSIQKHFQNGDRSAKLPDSNMWSSDEFKNHLCALGMATVWEERIYPGMKSAIIASLQCCQTNLEYRKNSFELYGADFMLSEDMRPWLIEINSSPALGASTPVTEVLCRNVIEDTLKVVLDRKENKQASTGRFELAFRQPYINLPSYMGCNIFVEGVCVKQNSSKPKKITSKENHDGDVSDTDNESRFQSAVVVTKSPSKDGETSNKTSKERIPLVPKLMYEKKNDTKTEVGKSKLDGIIEKLSSGATKLEINRKSHPEKPKVAATLTKIEKHRSFVKNIETKQMNKTKQSVEDVDNEVENEVVTKDKSKLRRRLEKMRSCDAVVSTNATSYAVPTTNINNVILSIAEAIETTKTLIQHDPKNCTVKRKPRKIGKSDTYEPSPIEKTCSCCCASSESLVEVLCPQVASYDLRAIKNYEQEHRLKKSKSKTSQQQSRTKTRQKQYGLLGTEDITGMKQGKNQQPYFLEGCNENISKHLRLLPTNTNLYDKNNFLKQ